MMAVIPGNGGGGGGWPSWPPVRPVLPPAPGPWGGLWPGGGGGGGGGGGQGGRPWQGEIPGWGPLPWTDWGQVPWANVPKGKGEEAQQWFNTMLPWLQAQVQQQQWGQSFDWRKAMDEWSKGFQESQFGWQKESDVWGRGFQETQLAQQRELEDARRLAEQEMANVATFGRRWKPSTRWM